MSRSYLLVDAKIAGDVQRLAELDADAVAAFAALWQPELLTELDALPWIRDAANLPADAAAWERLVTLYAPLVASWCRRWGVLQQDIVDVLQEVFSAVAAHLSRFRKDRPGDTFRGWLMTIARHKTLDYFQRKNREPAAIGGTEASMRLQDIRDPSPESLAMVSASRHSAAMRSAAARMSSSPASTRWVSG